VAYDMKQMQAQIVAEFKSHLGKDFDIVAEHPQLRRASLYPGDRITLDPATLRSALSSVWFRSRSADIQYRMTDGSGKKLLERKTRFGPTSTRRGPGRAGRSGIRLPKRSLIGLGRQTEIGDAVCVSCEIVRIRVLAFYAGSSLRSYE